MDESLGTQIATSAVPGSSFNRGALVPSSSRLGSGAAAAGPGGEPVTWDEMGQLGLHKALNEYYKLSASQRRLRLCQRGGAPGVLCCMVHTLVVPQLPAALAPPALFAAARALLYAAAWLLYQTAALTIPLALWLAFAAGGSLALSPDVVAAAARLNPALGHAARPLPTAAPLPRALVERPGAGLLILPLLLVLLRLAEGVVQRSRQEHWEQRRRRVTAADLQAQYQGWALPGSSTSVRSDAAAAAAVQLEQGAVLDALRHEVGQLWHAVYGGESLPPEQLTSMQDVAAAVVRLCQDTGVPVPAGANNGASGRLLLGTVRQIKTAVGLA